MAKGKIHLHEAKLCSNPLISNADIYIAFYRGGYNPAEIAKLFGKGYSTVWQQITRKLNPRYEAKFRLRRKKSRMKHPPKPRTKEQRHQEYLKYKVNKWIKEQTLREHGDQG